MNKPYDLTVSEISQSQKDKYCMISFYEVLTTDKFTKTESRMAVARGRGGEVEGRSGSYCLTGTRVSQFCKMEEFCGRILDTGECSTIR